jgi:hypothetical protein
MGSGPRTIDDYLSQAGSPLAQLDALLARERALEQREQLPFRGPRQTRYALLECPHCKQPALNDRLRQRAG